MNILWVASSVVTALDGYQMARQGKAGPGLGIAAFGSFIAGTLATFGLGLLLLKGMECVPVRKIPNRQHFFNE